MVASGGVVQWRATVIGIPNIWIRTPRKHHIDCIATVVPCSHMQRSVSLTAQDVRVRFVV